MAKSDNNTNGDDQKPYLFTPYQLRIGSNSPFNIVDMSKFSTDSLIYKKRTGTGDKIISFSIIHENKKKIIMSTPKLPMPFELGDMFNRVSGEITKIFPISCKTGNTCDEILALEKFTKCIEKLDNAGISIIKNNRTKLGLGKNFKYIDTITYKNNYPGVIQFYLPYDADEMPLFGIFDHNGKKASIDILKKNSLVSIVFEISELRINLEKKTCKTILTVGQIRKFGSLCQTKDYLLRNCILFDSSEPEPVVTPIMIPMPPPMTRQMQPDPFSPPPPPPMPTSRNNNNTPIADVPRFDMNELLQKVGKLKKVEKPIEKNGSLTGRIFTEEDQEKRKEQETEWAKRKLADKDNSLEKKNNSSEKKNNSSEKKDTNKKKRRKYDSSDEDSSDEEITKKKKKSRN